MWGVEKGSMSTPVTINIIKALELMGLEGTAADLLASVNDNYEEVVTEIDLDPGFAELEARVAALETGSGPKWITPTGGDDTAMVNDAAEEMSSRGTGIYGAAPERGVLRLDGRFQMSDKLVIRDCHVDASSAVLDFTADVPIGVEIGTDDYSCRYRNLRLPEITRDGVASEPGTQGLVIRRMDSCILDPLVWGFEESLVLEPTTGGVAYNTFNVRRVTGRKAMVIRPLAAGWANQNTFVGGSFSSLPADGESRCIVTYFGPHSPNNNVWLNPSIEGTPEYLFDIAGHWNMLINPRTELGSGASTVADGIFRGASRENSVLGGYNPPLDIVDESGENLVLNAKQFVLGVNG